MELGFRSACGITHCQTCLLHNDKRLKRCSGIVKRGDNCVNKAIGSLKPGMMPTCYIHRSQLKRTGLCQALLHCGFECGRICEWKLHRFQLCPDHRGHPMTCYFLKIPMEIRLRIYHLLLPDGPIPAQYVKSSLAGDGGGVYTAILRVNRQIHDEAAGLLYMARVFSIELHGDWLRMCNMSKYDAQNTSSSYDHHALGDYQLQRMLVEQQRLLITDQWQRILGGASGAALTPTIRDDQSRAKSAIFDASVPIEPIWDPPLSDRYFNMIQSFRVEIVFPPRNAWWLPNSGAASHEVSMSRLLDYCDHLHRLIGRLRIISEPITRLEIVIKFGKAYSFREKAFPIAEFLLRPFRRLRNVAKPDLLLITKEDSGDEIGLLIPGWASSPAGGEFAASLEGLFGMMSYSEPMTELPVFKAFWQLEKLISYLKGPYYHADPRIGQIASLLHIARFAREAEDLTRFREIWNKVVSTWFDYLNQHVDLQCNVARAIDSIYITVQNDS